MNKYFEKMSGECSFARESRSQDALGLGRIDVQYKHACRNDVIPPTSIRFAFSPAFIHRYDVENATWKRNGFPDFETTSIHRRR